MTRLAFEDAIDPQNHMYLVGTTEELRPCEPEEIDEASLSRPGGRGSAE